MTTPRTIRTQLAAITLNTTALNAQLPAALAELGRRLDNHDGYPTTASGADTRTSGAADLTPTEAAANHRLGDPESYIIRDTLGRPLIDSTGNTRHTYRPGPTAVLYDIDETLGLIIRAQTELFQLIARHTPPVANTMIRCDGRGLEGFDQWGEACYRAADKAGLCSRHYMACYRWRVEHGLRPLSSVVA